MPRVYSYREIRKHFVAELAVLELIKRKKNNSEILILTIGNNS